MTRHARLLTCSFGLLALLACGSGESGGGDSTGEPPAAADSPEVSSVVLDAAAALEASVAYADGLPTADDETADQVNSLIGYVAYSDTRTRPIGLAELADLGATAAAPLRDAALDAELPDVERSAALEALNELGGAAAGLALLETLEFGEPAWVRARSAWFLGNIGEDRTIPALVRRLKYEKDEETAVWIAWSLGQMGNLSGLNAQAVVRGREGASELWATIDSHFAELEERMDTDRAGLFELWNSPPSARTRIERSDAYQLEVWRWIARLDEFQLRGVDDARFICSQLGPAAARILADTLGDDSRYRRLHAAQSLQRMGPRARDATSALIDGLDLPNLASQAAESLGAIGGRGVLEALTARLHNDSEPALRLAAARGLGELDDDRAAPALGALIADPTSFLELRQAAAEGLSRWKPAASVIELLCEMRSDPSLESSTTERALLDWLERRADGESLELAQRLRSGEGDWTAVAKLAAEGDTGSSDGQ